MPVGEPRAGGRQEAAEGLGVAAFVPLFARCRHPPGNATARLRLEMAIALPVPGFTCDWMALRVSMASAVRRPITYGWTPNEPWTLWLRPTTPIVWPPGTDFGEGVRAKVVRCL